MQTSNKQSMLNLSSWYLDDHIQVKKSDKDLFFFTFSLMTYIFMQLVALKIA